MEEDFQSHAQYRAEQRYNKVLSKKDIRNIINSIKCGQYIFVADDKYDENKRFVYVKHNHIPYKVLYIKNQSKIKIITIYPFNVDEYNTLVKQKEEGKRIQRQDKEKEAILYLKSLGYIVYKRREHESNK